MSRLKIGLAAAVVLLSTSMLSGSASAMPANGLAPAAQAAGGIEKVRWVCGPYRCWWAPGPYWPGPRWGWGGWGWHRGWGWRRGWGWHGRRW